MNQGRFVGRVRGKMKQNQEEYIEVPDQWTGDEYQFQAPQYEEESQDFEPYVHVPCDPSDRHANVRMFIEEIPEFEEEEEPVYVLRENRR